jgi:hypothetical protein
MTLIKIRDRTVGPGQMVTREEAGTMFSLESFDVALTGLQSLRLWGYLDPGTEAYLQVRWQDVEFVFFLKSWVALQRQLGVDEVFAVMTTHTLSASRSMIRRFRLLPTRIRRQANLVYREH